MAYQTPTPQMSYQDTGRRTIQLLGHTMNASLAHLRESDALTLGAEVEIFIDKPARMVPQQIVGQVIQFNEILYRVIRVMDPKASEPAMKGRYLRLLCVREAA